VDALSHYGVSHIDMPTTPHSIWNVIGKGSLPQAAEKETIKATAGSG
jgi:carbon-monoxide dehydrogenase large subunit